MKRFQALTLFLLLFSAAFGQSKITIRVPQASGGGTSSFHAGYANAYFDDGGVTNATTAERVTDVLYGLLDNRTNETVVFQKTTTWADGTAMTDGKIDTVLYRKKGSEYFKRVVEGDYNIKWWGALGDSTINNLTNFQKAITAIKNIPGKKCLYFPSGTYLSGRTTSGVSFAALDLSGVANLTIRGDGASSVVQLIVGSYSADVFFLYCGATTHNITVRDITFDGNAFNHIVTNEQMHAAQVSLTAKDILFENCIFRSWFGDGLRLLGNNLTNYNERIRINKCQFLNNHRSGITMQRANRYVTISNNIFQGTNDQDIDFEPTGTGAPEDIVITGNLFDHSSRPGNIAITLTGISFNQRSTRVVFSNNIVKLGTLQAVDLSDMIIDGNIIYDTTSGGAIPIQFLGLVYNLSITNNSVTTRTTKAIKIYGQNELYPELVKIDGNRIKSNGEGILIEAFASDISITNNIISKYDSTADPGSLSAIYLHQTLTDSVGRNVQITGNIIRDYTDGIVVGSANGYLENVVISGNTINNVVTGNGIELTGAGSRWIGERLISNNTISSTSKILFVAGPAYYFTSGDQTSGNSVIVSRVAPEGAVTAGLNSVCYLNTVPAVYVKTTATGSTGWVTYGSQFYTIPSDAGHANDFLRASGSGTQTWATAPSGIGYTIELTGAETSPASGQSVYSGILSTASTTTQGRNNVYIPKTGYITRAIVHFQTAGTLGTSEAGSCAIMKNGVAAATLSSSIDNSSVTQDFAAVNLSVAVTGADANGTLHDRIEFRFSHPTWATNPTSVRYTVILYIEATP